MRLCNSDLITFETATKRIRNEAIFVTHDVGGQRNCRRTSRDVCRENSEIGDVADVLVLASPENAVFSSTATGSKGKARGNRRVTPRYERYLKDALSPRCKKVLDQCWHQKPAPEFYQLTNS